MVFFTEIYNRFLSKYALIGITNSEPPHLAQLKIILNLLNFTFGLIGISVLGQFKFTKMTYIMLLFLLFALLTMIYSAICVLDDTSLLLQSAILMGLFIPSVIKYYDLILKNENFVSLVEFSLHIFKVSLHAGKVAVLDAQISNNKRCVLTFVYVWTFALSLYGIGVIYTVYLKQLPAPFYMPFVDYTTTTGYTTGYVITLLIQLSSAILAFIGNISFLCLFSLIILHYDNLVALIQYDFKQVSKMVSRTEMSTRRAFFKKIAEQVIETRRYTKCVNDLFDKIVLWQIIMAIISATVSIFVLFAFKWYIGVTAALYFLGEIYIMCILGQVMSSTNDKLADVIYSVDWMNYSIKEQKLILSLLHMTQFNCVEIWIGIFAPLRIESGSVITQKIYNYTMLLFKMIDH